MTTEAVDVLLTALFVASASHSVALLKSCETGGDWSPPQKKKKKKNPNAKAKITSVSHSCLEATLTLSPLSQHAGWSSHQ